MISGSDGVRHGGRGGGLGGSDTLDEGTTGVGGGGVRTWTLVMFADGSR